MKRRTAVTPAADGESLMQDKRALTTGHKKRFLPYAVAMVLMTGAGVLLLSYYLHTGIEAMVRNTACALVCSVVSVFLYTASIVRHTLSYDNETKPGRFFAGYTAGFVFACAMRFVPYAAWPYAAVFVLLYLCSGETVAVHTGAFFLTLSVLLTGSAQKTALLMYLVCGICAVGLYYGYQRESSKSTILISVLSVQTVVMATCHLLFIHADVSLETFVIPLINLCITGVLLLLITHVFTVKVLVRHAERYLDINDPAFPLLQAIRTNNQDDYFRAVHTAYLAERIAVACNWDAGAVKTCALYHRIGCLEDSKSEWSEVEHYYSEFDFPPEAVALLHEYIAAQEKGPVSKEAACVLMCDTLVASLMYVFRKDKDAQVDYDEMIDRLFTHKSEEGAFAACNATMRDFADMKELLKKEKLYYDFLR